MYELGMPRGCECLNHYWDHLRLATLGMSIILFYFSGNFRPVATFLEFYINYRSSMWKT